MYEQNEEKNVNKSDEVIIKENINVVNKKIGRGLRKATTLSLVWLISIFVFLLFFSSVDSKDHFYVENIMECGSGTDGLAAIMLVLFACYVSIGIIIYLIPACIVWLTAKKGKDAAAISSCFCIAIYWFTMIGILYMSLNSFFPIITFGLSLITMIIGVLHIVSLVGYHKEQKNK